MRGPDESPGLLRFWVVQQRSTATVLITFGQPAGRIRSAWEAAGGERDRRSPTPDTARPRFSRCGSRRHWAARPSSLGAAGRAPHQDTRRAQRGARGPAPGPALLPTPTPARPPPARLTTRVDGRRTHDVAKAVRRCGSRRCLRRGRSGSGMEGGRTRVPAGGAWRWGNSRPACHRPRRSRADTAPGVQVVRKVACSTWTPGTAPAPRCVGRRRRNGSGGLGCWRPVQASALRPRPTARPRI